MAHRRLGELDHRRLRPDLDLVYWGTGNPGPDWNGDVRMGDNLYSDSAMALNMETGGLEWYFQFTPHDEHDWDAIQVPILADLQMGGEPRKVMMWANRNAFYYTLDRETGEFLVGTPFAKQTWAEGLDSNGRPIRIPDTFPTPEGTLVSRRSWAAPTGSRPPTARARSCSTCRPMTVRTCSTSVTRTTSKATSSRAGASGAAANRQLPKCGPRDRPEDGRHPVGIPDPAALDRRLLATAGDLVFSGSVDGYFFALDAVSGQELWHINVGRLVHSAPMTYAVDGRQYVTIAAGNVVYTFGLRD